MNITHERNVQEWTLHVRDMNRGQMQVACMEITLTDITSHCTLRPQVLTKDLRCLNSKVALKLVSNLTEK